MSRALLFYSKASDLGNKETALRLGALYQIDHDNAKTDIEKAFKSYIQAVKNGYREEAFLPLEHLGTMIDAPLQFELASLYQSVCNNNEKAKYWYAKAAESGHEAAKQKLSNLSTARHSSNLFRTVNSSTHQALAKTPLNNFRNHELQALLSTFTP